MIDLRDEKFEITPDNEFIERITPVMREINDLSKGKKAYDFFVKELMTALDNTAKNTDGAAFDAALNGNIFDYYRFEGKTAAFREIYDRVAKEYGLAYHFKLRPENSVQRPILAYVDDKVEEILPWDHMRGRRENELLRRKVSMAIGDAMYEAYNMGKMHSLYEELDKQIVEHDDK